MLKDITYCVSDSETIAATIAIRRWIADRQAEGWNVQPKVKVDNGQVGVMWQCCEHKDGRHEVMRFTDCISMTGQTFCMN